ncbi:putative glycosyltransferase [Geobacter sp. OR-1]|nr:putative glycosyltransferase [Geobacter sp. OR-1]
MFVSLMDKDLLFFSPAINSLPRHIPIDYLPVRFLKQAGVSLWFHFNAQRIISRYHLGSLNIHAGPGGVLCVRRLPVPVIVTCHHTYHQQISHIRSQFWKIIFLPFEKRTYRLADRIVAVSEATKAALIEHYEIPEHKIRVIHNAVDTGRFHQMKMQKKPHALLYIGRIDKRKGIEFLIRSMALVRRQLPDALLLVGGKGRDLKRMQTLVTRLDLERSVRFLGFVPDDQLNELYNQAQCVVVPSIFEGFGITVIEALATGTRVVGTDVDGIREILNSGEYGRLVPYDDHPALANAVIAELNEPKTAGALRPEYLVEQFREQYLEALKG